MVEPLLHGYTVTQRRDVTPVKGPTHVVTPGCDGLHRSNL